MSVSLIQAVRVEIKDDYPLIDTFLKWLINHPEVYSFPAGSSGRGNLIYWFPIEYEQALKDFFDTNDRGNG